MSRRKNSADRGFTLPEMLTVIVLFGIITAFVVAVIAPIMNAPNIQQAKIDTVQTGAQALYRLQRDIRDGQVNGVYVCTYPAPTTCSTPAPAPAPSAVEVLAILTPRTNGNGSVAFSSSSGQPTWAGFQVYWLVGDGNGTGTYNLTYAFSSAPADLPGAAAASADTAVNSALNSTSPETVAGHLLSLQIDQNVNAKTIGLILSSQSTVGSKVNESSFEGDAFARN